MVRKDPRRQTYRFVRFEPMYAIQSGVIAVTGQLKWIRIGGVLIFPCQEHDSHSAGFLGLRKTSSSEKSAFSLADESENQARSPVK